MELPDDSVMLLRRREFRATRWSILVCGGEIEKIFIFYIQAREIWENDHISLLFLWWKRSGKQQQNLSFLCSTYLCCLDWVKSVVGSLSHARAFISLALILLMIFLSERIYDLIRFIKGCFRQWAHLTEFHIYATSSGLTSFSLTPAHFLWNFRVFKVNKQIIEEAQFHYVPLARVN